jgi:hypothetical protein
MSNRNIFWGVKAAGVDCFKIWELQTPGTLSACTETALLFIHYNIHYNEINFKRNKMSFFLKKAVYEKRYDILFEV